MAPPVGTSYGIKDPETGNWGGIVGEVMKGNADFAINIISVTKQRSEVVAFSTQLLRNVNKLYIRKPVRAVSLTTFTEVLSSLFMVMVTITMCACSLTMATFFFSGSALERLSSGFTVVVLALLGLDTNLVVGSVLSVSKRVIVFTICLYGAMNLHTYTAGLTSSLTVEVFNIPIKTLSDLVDNQDYQIVIQDGGSDLLYFSEANVSNNPNGVKIYDQMIKGNPDAFVDSLRSGEVKIMSDGHYVLFAGKSTPYSCKLLSANQIHLCLIRGCG